MKHINLFQLENGNYNTWCNQIVDKDKVITYSLKFLESDCIVCLKKYTAEHERRSNRTCQICNKKKPQVKVSVGNDKIVCYGDCERMYKGDKTL